MTNATKKITSLVTLLCFLMTQSVTAYPGSGIEIGTPRETPSFLQINIPSELASVDGLFEAPAGSDPRMILHIQNAHANFGAQQKIKQLLQYLEKTYAIKTIFVEGASEDLDPDYLKMFPDKERNAKLAEYLAKQGELTGAELFILEENEDHRPQTIDHRLKTNESLKSQVSSLKSGPVRAVGIEDAGLYRENYEALKKVFGAEATVDKYLRGFEGRLETLSSKVFTADLRKLLSEWKKFEKGHREFMPYVRALATEAKRILNTDLESLFAQVEWPQITRLLVLQTMEKELDMKKGLAEKEQLIRFLKEKKLSAELIQSIERFQDQRVNMPREETRDKGGPVRPRDLMEELVTKAGPQGFRFADFPNFSLYSGYLILKSELDPKGLFNEIRALFQRILDELAKTPQQKTLLELYRDEELVRKLLNLELTRKDWQEVLARKDQLEPYAMVARLKELTQRLQTRDRRPQTTAPDGKTVIPESINRGSSNGVAKGLAPFPQEKAPDPNPSSVRVSKNAKFRAEVAEVQNAAHAFYEAARKREEVFYEKINEIMSGTGDRKAVLITGGFHTDGITELLREHEISYGILTPRLSEKSDEHLYRSVMLMNRSYPFEISNLEAISPLQGWAAQQSQAGDIRISGRRLRSILQGVITAADVDLQGAVKIVNTVLSNQKNSPIDRLERDDEASKRAHKPVYRIILRSILATPDQIFQVVDAMAGDASSQAAPQSASDVAVLLADIGRTTQQVQPEAQAPDAAADIQNIITAQAEQAHVSVPVFAAGVREGLRKQGIDKAGFEISGATKPAAGRSSVNSAVSQQSVEAAGGNKRASRTVTKAAKRAEVRMSPEPLNLQIGEGLVIVHNVEDIRSSEYGQALSAEESEFVKGRIAAILERISPTKEKLKSYLNRFRANDFFQMRKDNLGSIHGTADPAGVITLHTELLEKAMEAEERLREESLGDAERTDYEAVLHHLDITLLHESQHQIDFKNKDFIARGIPQKEENFLYEKSAMKETAEFYEGEVKDGIAIHHFRFSKSPTRTVGFALLSSNVSKKTIEDTWERVRRNIPTPPSVREGVGPGTRLEQQGPVVKPRLESHAPAVQPSREARTASEGKPAQPASADATAGRPAARAETRAIPPGESGESVEGASGPASQRVYEPFPARQWTEHGNYMLAPGNPPLKIAANYRLSDLVTFREHKIPFYCEIKINKYGQWGSLNFHYAQGKLVLDDAGKIIGVEWEIYNPLAIDRYMLSEVPKGKRIDTTDWQKRMESFVIGRSARPLILGHQEEAAQWFEKNQQYYPKLMITPTTGFTAAKQWEGQQVSVEYLDARLTKHVVTGKLAFIKFSGDPTPNGGETNLTWNVPLLVRLESEGEFTNLILYGGVPQSLYANKVAEGDGCLLSITPAEKLGNGSAQPAPTKDLTDKRAETRAEIGVPARLVDQLVSNLRENSIPAGRVKEIIGLDASNIRAQDNFVAIPILPILQANGLFVDSENSTFETRVLEEVYKRMNLSFVMENVILVEPKRGEKLSEFAKRMVERQNRQGGPFSIIRRRLNGPTTNPKPIVGYFNGIQLQATGLETEEDIIKQYEERSALSARTRDTPPPSAPSGAASAQPLPVRQAGAFAKASESKPIRAEARGGVLNAVLTRYGELTNSSSEITRLNLYRDLVGALLDTTDPSGNATVLYPFQGPDLFPSIFRPTFNINDDPNDLDQGGQMVWATTEDRDFFRKLRLLNREKKMDALSKESYDEFFRIRNDETSVLIVKGFALYSLSYSRADRAKAEKKRDATLQYALEGLRAGDKVLVMSENDRDLVSKGLKLHPTQDLRLYEGEALSVRNNLPGRLGKILEIPQTIWLIEKTPDGFKEIPIGSSIRTLRAETRSEARAGAEDSLLNGAQIGNGENALAQVRNGLTDPVAAYLIAGKLGITFEDPTESDSATKALIKVAREAPRSDLVTGYKVKGKTPENEWLSPGGLAFRILDRSKEGWKIGPNDFTQVPLIAPPGLSEVDSNAIKEGLFQVLKKAGIRLSGKPTDHVEALKIDKNGDIESGKINIHTVLPSDGMARTLEINDSQGIVPRSVDTQIEITIKIRGRMIETVGLVVPEYLDKTGKLTEALKKAINQLLQARFNLDEIFPEAPAPAPVIPVRTTPAPVANVPAQPPAEGTPFLPGFGGPQSPRRSDVRSAMSGLRAAVAGLLLMTGMVKGAEVNPVAKPGAGAVTPAGVERVVASQEGAEEIDFQKRLSDLAGRYKIDDLKEIALKDSNKEHRDRAAMKLVSLLWEARFNRYIGNETYERIREALSEVFSQSETGRGVKTIIDDVRSKHKVSDRYQMLAALSASMRLMEMKPEELPEELRNLVKLGKEAVPYLLSIVLDKNEQNAYVQSFAQRALVEMGRECVNAMPLLLEVRKKGEINVDDILAAIGKEGVPTLLERLQKDDFSVIDLLGRMGKNAEAALPLLKQIAMGESIRNYGIIYAGEAPKQFYPEHRLSAAKACAQIDAAAGVEVFVGLRVYRNDFFVIDSKDVVKSFGEVLKNNPELVAFIHEKIERRDKNSAWFADALLSTEDSKERLFLLQILEKWINEKQGNVIRIAEALALKVVGYDGSRQKLADIFVGALREKPDGSPLPAMDALEQLGKLKAREAVPEICKFLQKPKNVSLRVSAIETLVAIGAKGEAAVAVAGLLSDPDSTASVREAAARALAALGSQEQIGLLLKAAVTDSNESARYYAFETIAKILGEENFGDVKIWDYVSADEDPFMRNMYYRSRDVWRGEISYPDMKFIYEYLGNKQELPKNETDLQFSITRSLSIFFQRYGLKINERNIDLALPILLDARNSKASHPVAQQGTTVFISAHEEEEFSVENIEELLKPFEVTIVDKFKGPERRDAFLDAVSTCRLNPKGNLFWLYHHGGFDGVAFRKGEVGTAMSEAEQAALRATSKQLTDRLITRAKSQGTLEDMVIVVDACFSANFVTEILNLLTEALQKGDIKDLPVIIASTNRGDYMRVGEFLKDLQTVLKGKKEFNISTIYELDKILASVQDLTVFLPLTPEQTKAFEGILPQLERKQPTETQKPSKSGELKIPQGSSRQTSPYLQLGGFPSQEVKGVLNPMSPVLQVQNIPMLNQDGGDLVAVRSDLRGMSQESIQSWIDTIRSDPKTSKALREYGIDLTAGEGSVFSIHFIKMRNGQARMTAVDVKNPVKVDIAAAEAGGLAFFITHLESGTPKTLTLPFAVGRLTSVKDLPEKYPDIAAQLGVNRAEMRGGAKSGQSQRDQTAAVELWKAELFSLLKGFFKNFFVGQWEAIRSVGRFIRRFPKLIFRLAAVGVLAGAMQQGYTAYQEAQKNIADATTRSKNQDDWIRRIKVFSRINYGRASWRIFAVAADRGYGKELTDLTGAMGSFKDNKVSVQKGLGGIQAEHETFLHEILHGFMKEWSKADPEGYSAMVNEQTDIRQKLEASDWFKGFCRHQRSVGSLLSEKDWLDFWVKAAIEEAVVEFVAATAERADYLANLVLNGQLSPAEAEADLTGFMTKFQDYAMHVATTVKGYERASFPEARPVGASLGKWAINKAGGLIQYPFGNRLTVADLYKRVSLDQQIKSGSVLLPRMGAATSGMVLGHGTIETKIQDAAPQLPTGIQLASGSDGVLTVRFGAEGKAVPREKDVENVVGFVATTKAIFVAHLNSKNGTRLYARIPFSGEGANFPSRQVPKAWQISSTDLARDYPDIAAQFGLGPATQAPAPSLSASQRGEPADRGKRSETRQPADGRARAISPDTLPGAGAVQVSASIFTLPGDKKSFSFRVRAERTAAGYRVALIDPTTGKEWTDPRTGSLMQPIDLGTDGSIRIGRSGESHVQIPESDRGISNLHARIFNKDGTLFIMDESRNGTDRDRVRMPRNVAQPIFPETSQVDSAAETQVIFPEQMEQESTIDSNVTAFMDGITVYDFMSYRDEQGPVDLFLLVDADGKLLAHGRSREFQPTDVRAQTIGGKAFYGEVKFSADGMTWTGEGVPEEVREIINETLRRVAQRPDGQVFLNRFQTPGVVPVSPRLAAGRSESRGDQHAGSDLLENPFDAIPSERVTEANWEQMRQRFLDFRKTNKNGGKFFVRFKRFINGTLWFDEMVVVESVGDLDFPELRLRKGNKEALPERTTDQQWTKTPPIETGIYDEVYFYDRDKLRDFFKAHNKQIRLPEVDSDWEKYLYETPLSVIAAKIVSSPRVSSSSTRWWTPRNSSGKVRSEAREPLSKEAIQPYIERGRRALENARASKTRTDEIGRDPFPLMTFQVALELNIPWPNEDEEDKADAISKAFAKVFELTAGANANRGFEVWGLTKRNETISPEELTARIMLGEVVFDDREGRHFFALRSKSELPMPKELAAESLSKLKSMPNKEDIQVRLFQRFKSRFGLSKKPSEHVTISDISDLLDGGKEMVLTVKTITDDDTLLDRYDGDANRTALSQTRAEITVQVKGNTIQSVVARVPSYLDRSDRSKNDLEAAVKRWLQGMPEAEEEVLVAATPVPRAAIPQRQEKAQPTQEPFLPGFDARSEVRAKTDPRYQDRQVSDITTQLKAMPDLFRGVDLAALGVPRGRLTNDHWEQVAAKVLEAHRSMESAVHIQGFLDQESRFLASDFAERMLEIITQARQAGKEPNRKITVMTFGVGNKPDTGVSGYETYEILKAFNAAFKDPRLSQLQEDISKWKLTYLSFDINEQSLRDIRESFSDQEGLKERLGLSVNPSDVFELHFETADLFYPETIEDMLRRLSLSGEKADYVFERHMSYANYGASTLVNDWQNLNDAAVAAATQMVYRNILLAVGRNGTRYILEPTQHGNPDWPIYVPPGMQAMSKNRSLGFLKLVNFNQMRDASVQDWQDAIRATARSEARTGQEEPPGTQRMAPRWKEREILPNLFQRILLSSPVIFLFRLIGLAVFFGFMVYVYPAHWEMWVHMQENYKRVLSDPYYNSGVTLDLMHYFISFSFVASSIIMPFFIALVCFCIAKIPSFLGFSEPPSPEEFRQDLTKRMASGLGVSDYQEQREGTVPISIDTSSFLMMLSSLLIFLAVLPFFLLTSFAPRIAKEFRPIDSEIQKQAVSRASHLLDVLRTHKDGTLISPEEREEILQGVRDNILYTYSRKAMGGVGWSLLKRGYALYVNPLLEDASFLNALDHELIHFFKMRFNLIENDVPTAELYADLKSFDRGDIDPDKLTYYSKFADIDFRDPPKDVPLFWFGRELYYQEDLSVSERNTIARNVAMKWAGEAPGKGEAEPRFTYYLGIIQAGIVWSCAENLLAVYTHQYAADADGKPTRKVTITEEQIRRVIVAKLAKGEMKEDELWQLEAWGGAVLKEVPTVSGTQGTSSALSVLTGEDAKTREERRSEMRKAKVTVAQVRGNQFVRDSQQDSYINETLEIDGVGQVRVLAVLDGHGSLHGGDASKFFQKHLPGVLSESVKKAGDLTEDSVKRIIPKLQQMFRDYIAGKRLLKGRELDSWLSAGSTLSMVCEKEGDHKKIALVLGDSPILIFGRTFVNYTSNRHNTSNKDEVERLKSKGVRMESDSSGVLRVGGVLNVTRTLGDFKLEGQVSDEPEVTVVPVAGDKDVFVVIGTDGLDEAGDAYQTMSRVRYGSEAENAAENLIDMAGGNAAFDNVTVIVSREEKENQAVFGNKWESVKNMINEMARARDGAQLADIERKVIRQFKKENLLRIYVLLLPRLIRSHNMAMFETDQTKYQGLIKWVEARMLQLDPAWGARHIKDIKDVTPLKTLEMAENEVAMAEEAVLKDPVSKGLESLRSRVFLDGIGDRNFLNRAAQRFPRNGGGRDAGSRAETRATSSTQRRPVASNPLDSIPWELVTARNWGKLHEAFLKFEKANRNGNKFLIRFKEYINGRLQVDEIMAIDSIGDLENPVLHLSKGNKDPLPGMTTSQQWAGEASPGSLHYDEVFVCNSTDLEQFARRNNHYFRLPVASDGWEAFLYKTSRREMTELLQNFDDTLTPIRIKAGRAESRGEASLETDEEGWPTEAVLNRELAELLGETEAPRSSYRNGLFTGVGVASAVFLVLGMLTFKNPAASRAQILRELVNDTNTALVEYRRTGERNPAVTENILERMERNGISFNELRNMSREAFVEGRMGIPAEPVENAALNQPPTSSARVVPPFGGMILERQLPSMSETTLKVISGRSETRSEDLEKVEAMIQTLQNFLDDREVWNREDGLLERDIALGSQSPVVERWCREQVYALYRELSEKVMKGLGEKRDLIAEAVAQNERAQAMGFFGKISAGVVNRFKYKTTSEYLQEAQAILEMAWMRVFFIRGMNKINFRQLEQNNAGLANLSEAIFGEFFPEKKDTRSLYSPIRYLEDEFRRARLPLDREKLSEYLPQWILAGVKDFNAAQRRRDVPLPSFLPVAPSALAESAPAEARSEVRKGDRLNPEDLSDQWIQQLTAFENWQEMPPGDLQTVFANVRSRIVADKGELKKIKEAIQVIKAKLLWQRVLDWMALNKKQTQANQLEKRITLLTPILDKVFKALRINAKNVVLKFPPKVEFSSTDYEAMAMILQHEAGVVAMKDVLEELAKKKDMKVARVMYLDVQSFVEGIFEMLDLEMNRARLEKMMKVAEPYVNDEIRQKTAQKFGDDYRKLMADPLIVRAKANVSSLSDDELGRALGAINQFLSTAKFFRWTGPLVVEVQNLAKQWGNLDFAISRPKSVEPQKTFEKELFIRLVGNLEDVTAQVRQILLLLEKEGFDEKNRNMIEKKEGEIVAVMGEVSEQKRNITNSAAKAHLNGFLWEKVSDWTALEGELRSTPNVVDELKKRKIDPEKIRLPPTDVEEFYPSALKTGLSSQSGGEPPTRAEIRRALPAKQPEEVKYKAAALAEALTKMGFAKDVKLLWETHFSDVSGMKKENPAEGVEIRVARIVGGILKLNRTDPQAASEQLHMLAIAIGANAVRTLTAEFEKLFSRPVLPVSDQPGLVVEAIVKDMPLAEKLDALEAVLALNKSQYYGLIVPAGVDVAERLSKMPRDIQARVHVEVRKKNAVANIVTKVQKSISQGAVKGEAVVKIGVSYVVMGSKDDCNYFQDFSAGTFLEREDDREIPVFAVAGTAVAAAVSQTLLKGELVAEGTDRVIIKKGNRYYFNREKLENLYNSIVSEIQGLQSLLRAA